ncbi:conserved hypothetical protein [Microbacterium sp. 8M]|uniref:hypothetical protein n=1 Tax=Microbacterium sp. 8M TaxID=2653153 RepID=UPI0012F0CB12|nr:hypothetical protein [Microbacterium sp. 8M]VXB78229.1 conserved hypothetical protein [Microbacterium sp. 8M]
MTAEATAPAEPVAQRGRTILTGQALRHLAVALVAEASGAPAREISVRWTDDRGGLHAAVSVPLMLGDAAERTLADRGADLRSALMAGMAERAGRRVGGVDLRYTGVRRIQSRRVR